MAPGLGEAEEGGAMGDSYPPLGLGVGGVVRPKEPKKVPSGHPAQNRNLGGSALSKFIRL